MKILLCIFTIILVFTQMIFSLSFTEQTDNGWGFAGRCCKSEYFDLDGDEYLDLLIGVSDGTLSLYEQTTTTSLDFSLVTHHFCSIDIGADATPCIEDIDQDGLLDLLIGAWDGTVEHYEQTEENGSNFNLVSEVFQSIDVGFYSYPLLLNIDGDNQLDLLIGEGTGYPLEWGGNIDYYEQTSTGSVQFDLVTETFSDLTVGHFSYPCVFDLDSDNKLDFLIGYRLFEQSENGIEHYEQIATDSDELVLISDNFNNLNNVTPIPIPNLFDLTGDGNPELLMGNLYGGQSTYIQDQTNPSIFTFFSNVIPMFIDGFWPSADFCDIDGDSNFDMLIGNSSGTISHCEQNSFESNIFDVITYNFNGISVPERARPKILDIDGDGLLDLIIGTENEIQHYEQVSSYSYDFALVTSNFSNLSLSDFLSPVFVDIDHDNLLDLLITKIAFGAGTILHYEQSTIGSYQFDLINYNFTEFSDESRQSPAFTDLDGDGLWDAIVGNFSGTLNHFEQIDYNNYDFIEVNSCIEDIDNGSNSFPSFTDLNQDGLDDLIVAYSSGALHYYQRDYELIAEFAASQTSGSAPLNVQFTDISQGNPTSWEWDFNSDGIIDTNLQNPLFTFDESGYYDVTLTVHSSTYTNTITKENYIYVFPNNAVFGEIMDDTIWVTDVTVVGDVTIQNGVTLTIQPNVVVSFENNCRINVQGQIIAEGMFAEYITFTAVDTTNLSNQFLDEGGWQGIRFVDTPSENDFSSFEYCIFECGKAKGSYTSTDNYGAAIYVSNFEKLIIRICEFSNNWVSPNGAGVVALENAPITVERCTFTENSILVECWGLSLYLNNSDAVIQSCVFSNNIARHWDEPFNEWRYSPSGIYIYSSNPIIQNCLFADNYGVPLKLYYSNPVIFNNTIVNNIGGFTGGIMMTSLSLPKVANCIIYGNLAAYNNYEDQFYIDDDSYPDVTFCCLQELFLGNGNIIVDPQFIDSTNTDYRLQDSSLCIGAGIDEIEVGGNTYICPEFDLAGIQRPSPFGSMPDIGTYENQFGEPQTGEIENYILNIEDIGLLNFPNPFNPMTTISFSIPEESKVDLSIYNIKGQKIITLANNEFTKGLHSIIWNGDDENNNSVSSGIYFYKLNVNGKTEAVKNCLLLK